MMILRRFAFLVWRGASHIFKIMTRDEHMDGILCMNKYSGSRLSVVVGFKNAVLTFYFFPEGSVNDPIRCRRRKASIDVSSKTLSRLSHLLIRFSCSLIKSISSYYRSLPETVIAIEVSPRPRRSAPLAAGQYPGRHPAHGHDDHFSFQVQSMDTSIHPAICRSLLLFVTEPHSRFP